MTLIKPQANPHFRWISAEDTHALDRELMAHYNLLMEAEAVAGEYGGADLSEAKAEIERQLVSRYMDRLVAPDPVKELLAESDASQIFDDLLRIAMEQVMINGEELQ